MIKFAGVSIVFVLCITINSHAQIHNRAMPHVLVYKTKANYRNLVPVVLSPDKTKITSYPGPGDIKTGGANALPVLLHKGYLLDRRGIGLNSVFTKFTYDEYGQLTDLPTLPELYKDIVDKNPLTELYDCGTRNNGKNSMEQLNELIDKKELRKKCVVMKG